MRSSVLGLMFLGLLSLALACSEKIIPRTQLMAVLNADDIVRPQIRRLRIRVSGRAPEERDWGTPRFDQEYGQLEWPFRVGIAPDAGDARRRVMIEVVAITAEGEELMALRAITGFLPGRTLALPLLFESTCLHRACGNETCRAGDCVSADVDPKDLTDLVRFDDDGDLNQGERHDAGEPDDDGEGDGDDSGDGDRSDGEDAGDFLEGDGDGDEPDDLLDAGREQPVPDYSLCGKPGEESTPGEECGHVVTCGYAGRCDLSANICCTSSFGDIGGDCYAGTVCNLNARTFCDGPEDCSKDTVCCFAGGGTACTNECDLGSELCHVDADCSAGVCKRGSPGGETFWNYWGICR